jgi:hypothetical protein
MNLYALYCIVRTNERTVDNEYNAVSENYFRTQTRFDNKLFAQNPDYLSKLNKQRANNESSSKANKTKSLTCERWWYLMRDNAVTMESLFIAMGDTFFPPFLTFCLRLYILHVNVWCVSRKFTSNNIEIYFKVKHNCFYVDFELVECAKVKGWGWRKVWITLANYAVFTWERAQHKKKLSLVTCHKLLKRIWRMMLFLVSGSNMLEDAGSDKIKRFSFFFCNKVCWLENFRVKVYFSKENLLIFFWQYFSIKRIVQFFKAFSSSCRVFQNKKDSSV